MRFVFLRAYWKLVIFDLYLARGNFADLYGGTHLLRGQHGLHLVLEGSPLPPALRRNRVPAKAKRRAGADGDRCSAVAVQSPCMGGNGRPSHQRQAVYA